MAQNQFWKCLVSTPNSLRLATQMFRKKWVLATVSERFEEILARLLANPSWLARCPNCGANMPSTCVKNVSNMFQCMLHMIMLHITQTCYKQVSNICYCVECMRWPRVGSVRQTMFHTLFKHDVEILQARVGVIHPDFRRVLYMGCTCVSNT